MAEATGFADLDRPTQIGPYYVLVERLPANHGRVHITISPTPLAKGKVRHRKPGRLADGLTKPPESG